MSGIKGEVCGATGRGIETSRREIGQGVAGWIEGEGVGRLRGLRVGYVSPQSSHGALFFVDYVARAGGTVMFLRGAASGRDLTTRKHSFKHYSLSSHICLSTYVSIYSSI